jgi:O-antigen/teichoic acid export membrane protein
MLCLIAFTPIGDYLLKIFLGIDDTVTREAKRALGILAFLPFITGFRGFFQGLLMQQRRTALLSSATLIRVAALLVILGLGSRWLSGITLGAVGLFGCVTIETVIVGIIALRMPKPAALPDLDEKEPREILRFGFHLAYASCFQQAIPLLISALLGRLADATIALAAYGVARLFLLADRCATCNRPISRWSAAPRTLPP